MFQVTHFARAAAAALAALLIGAAHGASAQTLAPGEGTYLERCASCHDHSESSRAPSKANLKAMSYQTIDFALTQGKMKAMAEGMSGDVRGLLINYLTGGPATTDDSWTKAMMCPAERRVADLKGPATVATFGYDRANTRTLTAAQAGLTKAQLSNMELAWSIAIPGASAMRAQPAIVGKTVFYPVADAGALYAFDVSDAAKPCLKWLYKTPGGAPLRTSAAYGVLADGRGVLAFSGLDSGVYLVDARTGALLWTRKVGVYKFSMTTGTPTVLKTRIIVPVAQYEISVAADNKEVCCNNHGYILSLDPKTGAQQWRYDTMPDATPLRDRGDGKMLFGPSGAPIWNSPSVDEKRGLIYFGTGEANSPPAHKNTDALIAIGLNDGKERWSHQATERDIFNSGCGPKPKPTQLNCVTDTVYRDVDFGASFILGHLKSGQEMVYAGQKSGTVWAMDPVTGKVIWRRDLGTGSPLGGVHWGIAFKDDTIFAPISQIGRDLPGQTVGPEIKSGMYAIDAKTGAVKWTFATAPDCEGDRPQRMPRCKQIYGLSTAPAVIDGAVIGGSLDGYLYVLDAKTGGLLWKTDTAIPYQGVNGVSGKGGSIDAASITAVNGLLLVNSGYGMFGEVAGNVILAFKPKAK
ncbi:PQQ-binding-like beta-propeller repeat protein [Phenylobacterium sp.]|uniref:outer membrane protein assembly factor BamB family protein n=1 Tax=Phenylobacterium sp. TaxID=1871053 RepID=UPI0035658AF4